MTTGIIIIATLLVIAAYKVGLVVGTARGFTNAYQMLDGDKKGGNNAEAGN